MKIETSIDYKACAEKVLAYHGFSPECAAAEKGLINSVFIGEAVVRIPKEDKHNFHAEKFAMNLARDNGLPVPCVLAVDDSKSVVPVSYMLEERVFGCQVDRLTSDLIIELGSMLAKLHSLPVEGYGILSPVGTGIRSSWKEYVEHRQNFARTEVAKIDPGLAERSSAVYDELAKLNVAPCFLHGDYHQGNLFFEGDEISGVIDFMARSGSPIFEVANTLLMTGVPVSDFERGYGMKFDERMLSMHLVDVISGKLPPMSKAVPKRGEFLKNKLEEILKKLGK